MIKPILFTFFLANPLIAAAAGAEEVHIGLASNFSEVATGNANPYGDYFRNGVRLALEDRGSELSKKSIKITLDEFDYGNSVTRVKDAVERAAKSSVVALIGYNYSSHALIAGPLHQTFKLPMITPSATADRVAAFGAFVHPACINNAFMGKILARVADKKLKAKSIAIVTAADCAYCQDLTRAFKAEVDRAGRAQIVSSLQILEGDTDFANVVSQLKISKPDVILVPNQELVSARVIAALVRAGIKVPFLGGDGWGDAGAEFFTVLQDAAIQGYSVSHWHPALKSPVSEKFLKAYREKFGRAPNDTAVLAYDAMSILVTALLNTKKYDRTNVELALNNISRHEGITGLLRFKKEAAPEKSVVLLAVEQRKFKVDSVWNPDGSIQDQR